MRGGLCNEINADKNRKICDLLRSRNKAGLNLLFQIYYTPLVLWANTFLDNLPAAEDLVQEFFIAVWEDRIYERFYPHNLSSFLRLIIKNKALNRLEKKDVLRKTMEIDRIELAWEEYNDQHDQIIAAVQKELLSLPPRSREIMSLVFQRGMKYQEVATLLDISLSTVKNLVVKSMEKLKRQLSNETLIYFFAFFKKNGK